MSDIYCVTGGGAFGENQRAQRAKQAEELTEMIDDAWSEVTTPEDKTGESETAPPSLKQPSRSAKRKRQSNG
jgi:hypothetical protein